MTPTLTGAYTLHDAAGGGLAGMDFRFGTLTGAMPIGRTFTFDDLEHRRFV